jgi:hypothetical protein
MNIEQKLEAIEKRLSLLEQGSGLNGETAVEKSIIEMDLVLPEADIGGLHFNETKVHAVFEKQEDGWYYSRDILSISARNIEDDNSRDILTEYLNSSGFKRSLAYALSDLEIWPYEVDEDELKVSLSLEPQGAKKYNGVAWPYWLKSPRSDNIYDFCLVYTSGAAGRSSAHTAYGFAPAFRVGKEVTP